MDLLTPTEARRLAFVRYLYQLGERQSREAEPIGATSLLIFHDAVELFLQLASEKVNAGKREPSFIEYWDLIRQELPGEAALSQKEAMRRLNKSRVALKHHGTLPSRLALEEFRASVTAFFEDNTPTVFGVEFSDISMIEFVEPEEARRRLETAQHHLAQGNLLKGSSEAAIAFNAMLDDYEDRKRDRFHRSPFLFSQEMRGLDSFFMRLATGSASRGGGDQLTQRLAEFINKTKASLDSMGNALKVMALGIDYRRYSRFRMLAGTATRMAGGSYRTYRPQDSLGEDSLTPEDVRFCIDFVIEAAITLQEFDYTTPAAAIEREAKR